MAPVPPTALALPPARESPSTGTVRPGALGRAVRRRGEDLGLSQEVVSARAGLHENYVGGIERGERNTSIVNVLKLTGALELRPSELMSRLEAELRLMDEIEE